MFVPYRWPEAELPPRSERPRPSRRIDVASCFAVVARELERHDALWSAGSALAGPVGKAGYEAAVALRSKCILPEAAQALAALLLMVTHPEGEGTAWSPATVAGSEGLVDLYAAEGRLPLVVQAFAAMWDLHVKLYRMVLSRPAVAACVVPWPFGDEIAPGEEGRSIVEGRSFDLKPGAWGTLRRALWEADDAAYAAAREAAA
jgi:hypothetical protein